MLAKLQTNADDHLSVLLSYIAITTFLTCCLAGETVVHDSSPLSQHVLSAVIYAHRCVIVQGLEETMNSMCGTLQKAPIGPTP